VLEAMVRLDRRHLPHDLVSHRIQLPDGLVEQPTEVPSAWFVDPLRRQTRRFGDTWISEMRSLALRVPSAVIPTEFNLLLNPNHKDVGRIELLDEQPFAFDARLRHG
jgi:RES domain-containing protein